MRFRLACIVAFVCIAWPRAVAAQTPKGWSSWDMQGLYGFQFAEPFNPNAVAKGIVTFENSSGWSWGSSYFFVDILRSDGDDQHAAEVYSEWYPAASLSKLSGKKLSVGPLRDVSASLGLNMGVKSTGAAPFVVLPGLAFDLKIPGFKFFSLGTYAHIDRGRLSGASNDCHSTTYQVTPSWSLPIGIRTMKVSFDGFVDMIGSHGQCASQVLSQPQLKVDLGGLWGKPGKFSAGVEWQYWHNKFGISDLDESFPQFLVQWVF